MAHPIQEKGEGEARWSRQRGLLTPEHTTRGDVEKSAPNLSFRALVKLHSQTLIARELTVTLAAARAIAAQLPEALLPII